MKIKQLKQLTPLLLGATICFYSCNKSDDYKIEKPLPKNSVELTNSTRFGSVLVNKDGFTLYSFALDADSTSNCNGNCNLTWPVFYDASLTVATGLELSDFGTIIRSDGSKQTTYKGWPLYKFANDVKAGDFNGDAIGNTWFVAKPDYTVMLANKQLLGKDGIEYTSKYVPGKEIVQYITDDRGLTLYSFSKDKQGMNTFTKADLSNNNIWPVDEIKSVGNVPSILNKADFKYISVFGKTQLTFRGWPLYQFGADQRKKGSNKGVSVGPGLFPVNNNATIPAI